MFYQWGPGLTAELDYRRTELMKLRRQVSGRGRRARHAATTAATATAATAPRVGKVAVVGNCPPASPARAA
jgi:hypothetical protein